MPGDRRGRGRGEVGAAVRYSRIKRLRIGGGSLPSGRHLSRRTTRQPQLSRGRLPGGTWPEHSEEVHGWGDVYEPRVEESRECATPSYGAGIDLSTGAPRAVRLDDKLRNDPKVPYCRHFYRRSPRRRSAGGGTTCDGKGSRASIMAGQRGWTGEEGGIQRPQPCQRR